MRYFDMKTFLLTLRNERDALHYELEDNGGEVTDSVLSREDKIANLREIFKQEGGIDAVGRYMKEGQDKIQSWKDEKAYAERHLKAEESKLADDLEMINEALEQEDIQQAKGKYGYSFTPHTSVITKADNKMIKERFYNAVEKVVRESGVVPKDITFTLSASSSLLSEGAEKPEWYNTISKGRATFRKPRKTEDNWEQDEF